MPAKDVRELVRRYQVHMVNTGGNDPVELLDGRTPYQINAPLAFVEHGIQSQAGLLLALHRAGLLREEAEAPAKPRRCFWISGKQTDDGGFVPSMVTENEAGHSPMMGGPGGSPWVWGATLERAREVCAEVNHTRFGISPDEAAEIVRSSILATNSKK